MRVLSLLATAAFATLMASTTALAQTACPTPTRSSVIQVGGGNGYDWSFNSDGYPHLVVYSGMIAEWRIPHLRVSCGVMSEVQNFGGRFQVVYVHHLGQGSIAADVTLDNIERLDVIYDDSPNPRLWQRQSQRIRRSPVPAAVAQILREMSWSLLYNNQAWELEFVHRDDLGANDLTYRVSRSPYQGRRTITFTGNFNTAGNKADRIIRTTNRLED